jgi:hypothetical protein
MQCQAPDAPQCAHCQRRATTQCARYGQQKCQLITARVLSNLEWLSDPCDVGCVPPPYFGLTRAFSEAAALDQLLSLNEHCTPRRPPPSERRNTGLEACAVPRADDMSSETPATPPLQHRYLHKSNEEAARKCTAAGRLWFQASDRITPLSRKRGPASGRGESSASGLVEKT